MNLLLMDNNLARHRNVQRVVAELQVEDLQDKLAIQESIIAEKDSLIAIAAKHNESALQTLSDVRKALVKADRRIKWLTIQRGALGVIVMALAVGWYVDTH